MHENSRMKNGNENDRNESERMKNENETEHEIQTWKWKTYHERMEVLSSYHIIGTDLSCMRIHAWKMEMKTTEMKVKEWKMKMKQNMKFKHENERHIMKEWKFLVHRESQ